MPKILLVAFVSCIVCVHVSSKNLVTPSSTYSPSSSSAEFSSVILFLTLHLPPFQSHPRFQATRIVARMTAERAENPDKAVPREILRRARGLAFIRVAKVGFGLSVKVGTGIVVTRLGDNLDSWSAPCAIGTAGKMMTRKKLETTKPIRR